MPRPRNKLAGSTEWLLCRREVERIFARHKAPAGFFEQHGPLVFGAVSTASLSEPLALMLAALITRHRRLLPRLLCDCRRLFERKQRTALFAAAQWIAARWRMIRAENPRAQWPFDDGTTAQLIGRDTGRRDIGKQTVKDARKLLNLCAAPPDAKPQRLRAHKLDAPAKRRRFVRAVCASQLNAPEHYLARLV